MDREEKLRQTLISKGFDARSLKSELLVEPWELETRFTVLHNYMAAWMNFPPPPMPSPAPAPAPLIKGGSKVRTLCHKSSTQVSFSNRLFTVRSATVLVGDFIEC
mmetsp:Transcript_20294/g.81822  ORF Transcript_20294/g.81822 Transcript_20294/m.81822 type:complete len:105 (-) Transcript_20294:2120-2434(-)